MSKQGFVTAEKDGRKKQFTLHNWESMPSDKYGWILIQDSVKIPTPPEAIVKDKTEEVVTEKVSILPEKPKGRPKK